MNPLAVPASLFSLSPTTLSYFALLIFLSPLHAQEDLSTTLPPIPTLPESLNNDESAPTESADKLFECEPEYVSFEMVTGFVYTAPQDMLDSQPGTLMLTKCIETCARNSSCLSINYETGLCVIFSSSASGNGGQLTPSQFPVFTIYVQKTCLKHAAQCKNAWSFERVMNHELTGFEPEKSSEAEDREDCMDLCLSETEFECRSANYQASSKSCSLSSRDRHAQAGFPGFNTAEGTDYLEINCVSDPNKLCVYDQTKGKILKTVDSVYQAIASKEDCQDLCNNAPFRCHSFDFNDTGDNVCRLSHHSVFTLTQIEEPYLAIEEATTYGLNACYDVSINCHASDMTATVITSTVFNGKVYAKGSPSTCVVDIKESMNFTITMAYNDLECGVVKEGPGSYSNEVIIQHHDRIVTSSDLGLSLSCQYDLTNKSVANAVDMTITGEISPALYEEAVVESPNVIMRVADQTGQNTKTAVVGDPLSLIFEVIDPESPYEIFIRDLVALDGATTNELELIDSRGCPVDTSIMSEVRQSDLGEKTLVSLFDAFRFPTSDMVQFRAMVTPCIPICPPVQCDIIDYTGQSLTVDSFGKRRRRRDISANHNPLVSQRVKRSVDPTEVLVVESLRIVDRYGKSTKKSDSKNRQQKDKNDLRFLEDDLFSSEDISSASTSSCFEEASLIVGAIIFIVVQLCLLLLWTFLWKRKRALLAKEVLVPSFGGSESGYTASSDSLSYLYESRIPHVRRNH
uniref:Putative LOC101887535 [Musca domestica] n=1 Tax=Lepeophtheirus salmonis TaxID=72036 RepID=A0A0K2TPD6_LEPSM